MTDFEIPKCSRVCSKTGRTLQPEETYYSALLEEEGDLKRLDFAPEAWRPDPHYLGWWRSTIPSASEKKIKMAPNDILLSLFDQWITDPNHQDYLYILTLLMVRRRIFRFEKEERHLVDSPDWPSHLGNLTPTRESTATSFPEESKTMEIPLMVVYSPRRETTYSIPIVTLDDSRIEKIQKELTDLLFTGSDSIPSPSIREGE